MGHEIAGTVVECGPLVKRFQPGDRIAVIQRIVPETPESSTFWSTFRGSDGRGYTFGPAPTSGRS